MRQVTQLSQLERRFRCEWMRCRKQNPGGRAIQDWKDFVTRDELTQNESHSYVDTPFPKCWPRVGVAELCYDNVDLRMGRATCREQLRDERRVNNESTTADLQLGCMARVDRAGAGHRVGRALEGSFRAGEKCFSRRCEPNAASESLQQLRADFRLEIPNLLGERRLR